MKINKKGKAVLLLLVFIAITVILQPMVANATTVDPRVSEALSKDDDSGEESDGIIKRLISTTKNLISSVEDLVYNLTHITEILQLWFEAWFISILDGFLDPLVNIWSTYMINTPLIGPVGFVQKTWNLSLFYAIPLFGLALIPMAWRMWTAKNSTGLKQPILLFLKAVSGCMFTLYIIDFILVLKNKVSVAMAEAWLVDAYTRLGEEPLPMEATNGITMLKAALATEVASMEPGITLGNVFFNELGWFWVFVAIPLLAIISLVMFLSWVLLTLLGISAPVYFTISVLLNKMESLAGWINLTLRTIMVPVLFLIAWGICVNANDPSFSMDVGVSPMLLCLLIFGVALILSWLVWIKSAYRAVAHPLTLNGGEVMERGGEWLTGASSFFKTASRNMGLERIADTSEKVEGFGEKVRDFGANAKRYSQSIRPRQSNTVLDKDPLPLPTFLWQQSTSPTGTGQWQSEGATSGTYIAPTPEAAKQIGKDFEQYGIKVQVKDNKIHVKVEQKTTKEVDEILKKIYSDKIPYWKVGHEYLTLENGLPVRNPQPPANGIYMGEFKADN